MKPRESSHCSFCRPGSGHHLHSIPRTGQGPSSGPPVNPWQPQLLALGRVLAATMPEGEARVHARLATQQA